MKKYSDLEILNIDYSEYKTRVAEKYKSRKLYKPRLTSSIVSFIPGTVIELLVKEGDDVEYGQELLILDAMKMKNRMLATSAGRVKAILVSPGDRVSKGSVLVEIE